MKEWLRDNTSLIILTIILFALLWSWVWTREREIFILASGVVGAISGIARGKTSATPATEIQNQIVDNQAVETQNVDTTIKSKL